MTRVVRKVQMNLDVRNGSSGEGRKGVVEAEERICSWLVKEACEG